jgi:hypothetical protein
MASAHFQPSICRGYGGDVGGRMSGHSLEKGGGQAD